MIVYGSSFSPYVRKVLAYCAERGIAVESRATRIGDDDPIFRAASPFGKMPAIVDGDYGLPDSSAIIHYLEAKLPKGPLIPADPKARGRVIWFDEFGDTILMGCMQKLFFNRIVSPRFLGRPGNLEAAEAAEKNELPPIFDYLESVIPAKGYLVGDTLTLADLSVASPLANLVHMDMMLDHGRHPNLAAYAERVLARSSFASWIEREQKFLQRAG